MTIARQGIWLCPECNNHEVWKTRDVDTKQIDRKCSHCNKKTNEYEPVDLEQALNLPVLGSLPRNKDLTRFNPLKSPTFFEPIYNKLIELL